MTRVEYLGADRLIYGTLVGDFSDQKVIARLPATVTVDIEPADHLRFHRGGKRAKVFRYVHGAPHRRRGRSEARRHGIPLFTMTAAARATLARTPRRCYSIIDSERWLGPLLIGPAVLYILLLVGVAVFHGSLLQRQQHHHRRRHNGLRRPAQFHRGRRHAQVPDCSEEHDCLCA